MKEASKQPVSIRLSVYVSDDSFESTFTIPINAGKEQINQITKAWLGALQSAIEISADTKKSG